MNVPRVLLPFVMPLIVIIKLNVRYEILPPSNIFLTQNPAPPDKAERLKPTIDKHILSSDRISNGQPAEAMAE